MRRESFIFGGILRESSSGSGVTFTIYPDFMFVINWGDCVLPKRTLYIPILSFILLKTKLLVLKDVDPNSYSYVSFPFFSSTVGESRNILDGTDEGPVWHPLQSAKASYIADLLLTRTI